MSAMCAAGPPKAIQPSVKKSRPTSSKWFPVGGWTVGGARGVSTTSLSDVSRVSLTYTLLAEGDDTCDRLAIASFGRRLTQVLHLDRVPPAIGPCPIDVGDIVHPG